MSKIMLFIATVLLVAVSSPSLVLSHEEETHSVDEILNEILQSQGVSKTDQIDCEKITDSQFEELGEAAMNFMHPDEKEHELMDQMMGGEGSESLKAIHITMGERYFGCNKGIMGSNTMGLMGMMSMMQMMAGGGNSATGNMMNWGNWSFRSGWTWLGWILMILFFVLIIVTIIVLIKWLTDQLRGKTKNRSALNILEERYAKGEIDKKEFEEKKRNLA